MIARCNFQIILVLITIITTFGDKRNGTYSTTQDMYEELPQLCVFGEHKDFFNRSVCFKGPGEKCGGKFHFYGICAEGLWCSSKDNRCHGCYIPTLTCTTEE